MPNYDKMEFLSYIRKFYLLVFNEIQILTFKISSQFDTKFKPQCKVDLFKDIKIAYLSNRLCGLYSVELNHNRIEGRYRNAIFKLIYYLFIVWNWIITGFIIFFAITSLIGIFMPAKEKLAIVVDLIRFSACFYRTLILRSQRKRMVQLIIDIQHSLDEFPSALIRIRIWHKILASIYWIYVLFQCNVIIKTIFDVNFF
jgi:hypothetical protein